MNVPAPLDSQPYVGQQLLPKTDSLTLRGPSAKKGPILWCLPMEFPIAKTNSRKVAITPMLTMTFARLPLSASRSFDTGHHGVLVSQNQATTTGRSGIEHWPVALSTAWSRSSTCCTLVSPILSTALPISDGWTRSVDTSRHSSTAIKNRDGSHQSMSQASRQRIQVVWECGMTGSRQGPITRGSWPILCWPTWRRWRAFVAIVAAGGLGPKDFPVPVAVEPRGRC